MAIPAILIAIALVALWRGSIVTVVVAIAIPEIPRVTRLVRSLVLTIREEPYVEAAVALGTPTWKILLGHILPNCIAPLMVQGTYICAFAILVEAILSFLGVGLPPDIPTWGNIMAEGRVQFIAVPAQRVLPGRVPRGHGAGGQHPGRRPARHARPEDGEAGMSPVLEREFGPEHRAAAGRRTARTRCRTSRFSGRPRRDRLPGRRIGLGQVGDRAERDGPAAEDAAGRRRARFPCSRRRHHAREGGAPARSCARRACRWSSRSR